MTVDQLLNGAAFVAFIGLMLRNEARISKLEAVLEITRKECSLLWRQYGKTQAQDPGS